MAGPTAPDEQGIAETVEVAQNLAVRRQSYADAFGAPADGPAYVEFGVEPRTAGQHERSQRREAFVHAIDFTLQLFALGRRDARLPGVDVFRESREDGAEIEQLMLDAQKNSIEFRQLARRFAREADETVQLVDGPVGFDAEVIFGKPLAADEAGLARVAAPCVDAVDGEA